MEPALQKCLDEVNSCTKCAGICEAIGPYGQDIGLNYIDPVFPVEVLFVAESPPPVKDNFFYNEKATDTRFRERLFKLINLAGMKTANSIEEFNLRGYYLADTINCRWNKDKKKVKQPSQKQLDTFTSNCLNFMRIQLELLKPKSIVFMGKLAEEARNSKSLRTIVSELKISDKHIIEIPFIITAPVKTEIFVKKLSVLSCFGIETNSS